MSEAKEKLFQAWPKIHRLNREIIVTEKIDGTNSAIIIDECGAAFFQSRNRIITPDDDNFGFARWATHNADHLIRVLGPGHHFGEWYGLGIQRGYGLKDKRFMLFNVHRWGGISLPVPQLEVATVLYRGPFETSVVNSAVADLRDNGSAHVPGFMKPEGVVAYHVAGNLGFKVSCLKDEKSKFEL